MQDDDITIERDGHEEDGGSEAELEERESRADTKLAKLRGELETAKRERQEHLDGWQRAKADYVNALRRHEEERASLAEGALARAARAFLPAMDSLVRAETAGEIPPAFSGIAKQLHDGASSLGLSRFGAEGDLFDPSLHEALGQDAVESAERDGAVTAVLEQGWKAGDAVLRPAKVRVGAFGG